MSKMKKDDAERRTNFRIDDELIFDFRKISRHDSNNLLTDDFANDEPIVQCMRVIDELRDIDTLSQPALQRISLHNPTTADYLRTTNRKFELLLRFLSEELLAKFVLHADERVRESINISAGGLAFWSSEPLEKLDLLKVKIILMPSYECVLTTAEVVACLHKQSGLNPEKPYRVSARFEKLADHDEQRIIRHIYTKQIRDHKAEKNKDDGHGDESS